MRGDSWRFLPAIVLGAAVLGPSALSGQTPAWRVTAGASQVWFGSVAEDTMTGDFTVRPSATTGWSVAADHRLGRLRAGIGLSYSSSHIEGSGAGASIIDHDAHMRALEVSVLLTLPIARIGTQGAEFLVTAGPALTIWDLTGEESQTVFGGTAALQFAVPISSGWRFLAAAGGSLSGSPVEDVALSGEFEPTSLLSGRVGLGLQYGF